MLKINSNVEVVKETNYLNIFFLLNGVCLYVNRCAHARIDMYGTKSLNKKFKFKKI